MSKRTVHIENLNLRLPRSSASSAREIAASVGGQLLRNLSENHGKFRGSLRLEKISAVKIQVPNGSDVDDMTVRIAASVAADIQKL